MTNDESEVILRIYDKFKKLIEENKIKDFNLKINNETGEIDLFIEPIQTPENINIDFTISGKT